MSGRGRRRGGIVRRTSVDDDVAREIRAHLALRTEELVEDGWERGAAEAEALRLFGDVDGIARTCVSTTRGHERDVRRWEMMDAARQDVKYALRALARAPGFALVALVTLALGIGANTTIFSVVNGVLLRPLPHPDPHELVWVDEISRSGGAMAAAWANFQDWRDESGSFEALAAFGTGATTVLGGNEPARSTVSVVSEDFWRVFGVAPGSGRTTVPADHREGAAPVAVVSPGFASGVLEGVALGRAIEVRGVVFEVVGVAPAGFDYPRGTAVWIPVELTPQGTSRTAHNWRVVGRLAEGVGVERAATEIDALTVRLAAQAPPEEQGDFLAVGARVTSLRERTVGAAQRPLLMLLGAAALVLLVACTNLASTLLARGATRVEEFSVRSALGAGRGRLTRQLLTEAGVLASAGALLGVGFAYLALRVVRALGGGSVPRLEGVTIAPPVLLFTVGVTLLTALAFGLLPARRAARADQASTLRGGARGGAAKGRVWGALVASEVALALVLLVGAGLLLRSFAAVLAEDAGVDPTDVAVVPLALSASKYAELDDHRIFWDMMLERADALPGVSAAGLIDTRPVSGFAANGRVSLDGDATKLAEGVYVVASEGAFEALDIPLERGRLFDGRDGPDDPHVVVVSRSFAERWWPGEDPIGKQVSGGGMDNFWDADPPMYGTVVGVVGDVRYRSLTRQGEATVYWSYRQRPFRIRFGATLLAESGNGDPAAVARGLAASVREADADVAVRVQYLADMVAGSLGERRFVLWVLASFAAVALLLAGVGIYGVVSYAVARRTREMGIRLALGARPESVRSMVLLGALRPVVAGLIAGVGLGLGATRLIRGLLHGVEPADPLTFAAVVVLLLGAGVLASWVPAVRGTRVDPVRAMRAD